MRFRKVICAVLCASAAQTAVHAYDLKAIYETIPERTRLTIEWDAETTFPNPEIGSGADYAIGMVDYAMSNLWCNRNIEKCNEYIVYVAENHNAMIPHTGDYKTYFQMTCMARIWFLYNHNSLYYPGRLTAEAEEGIKKYFYAFLEYEDNIEYASKYDGDIYYLQSSGNHHVIKRCAFLMGAQILMTDEAYAEAELPDGATVKEHYAAWENYWIHDIAYRGKKALEVEYAANGYYKYTMDVFMTLRDFANSSIIRDLAQRYLDVIFADIAIQSNNGYYGGARGRSTRYSDANTPIETFVFAEWYNLQSSWRIPGASDPVTGEPMSNRITNAAGATSKHPNQISVVMSPYMPVQPVADLALNYMNRGSYEYKSSVPGRGNTVEVQWNTFEFPPEYIRYSYVTPDYIVGSFTYNRGLSYNDVMGQNKQAGIHFNTENFETAMLSRVFPDTERSYDRGFFDLNTVAHKSAMLCQGLPEAKYFDSSVHADIIICVTKDIYDTITEENGWLFGYIGDSYIAIKPTKGQFKEWKEYKSNSNVMAAYFTQKFAPVILQAGSKSEYGSYEAFKTAVSAAKIEWKGLSEVEYTGPLDVGTITCFTNYSIPKINGVQIELSPEKMIESPYLNSVWGTGEFDIVNTKNESCHINFEYDLNDEVGPSVMKSHEYVSDWNGMKLKLNGSYLSAQPIMIDGVKYICLRDVLNYFDIGLCWSDTDRSLKTKLDGEIYRMKIGDELLVSKTKEIRLDEPLRLVGGRTMVSSDFLEKALGAKVKWDGENNTIVVWKGASRG